MKVSIVIVSWNVRKLLKNCLASIYKHTRGIDFEVYVVDNFSTDGTVEMIKENFPQVKLIANDCNAGFAKANNQPLKRDIGQEVLFMNPDMEFVENTAKIMHEVMQNNPGVDISTCRLEYPDGQRQNNIKRLPGFWSQLFIMLKLHHLFKFLPFIKNYLAKDFDYSQEQFVENIMGAFVYARTEQFKSIGAWNEKYWLWWEDVDLCKTAKDNGLKILYTPKTRVIHYEGKSFEQVASPKKQKRFIRGMLKYFLTHHSLYQFIILAVLSPVSIALSYIVYFLKIKPRPQSRV